MLPSHFITLNEFWVFCMGQCPGTAEESHGKYGDWRLRSAYCQTWKDMFGEAEGRMLADGKTPISRHPKIKLIEQILYDTWKNNKEMLLSSAIKVAEGTMTFANAEHGVNRHGDHWDTNRPH